MADDTKVIPSVGEHAVPLLGDAPDAATAEVWARQRGRRVRVADMLTASSTTYVEPDGRRTVVVSAAPERVRRGAGWADIDTTLASATRLSPRAASLPVSFSAGRAADGGPLMSVGEVGSGLELLPAGVSVEPAFNGPVATYPDALGQGQDVVLQALPDGAEFSVVLHARPVAPVVFRLPLRLRGLTPSGLDGRTLLDGQGRTALQVTSGSVHDASRTTADGRPGREAALATRVEVGKDGPELVMTPDAAFLADPATVYPVTVDPSVTNPYEDFDAWINTSQTTPTDADTALHVGWDGHWNSADRALMSWNLGSLIGHGVTIVDATIYDFQQFATTCNNGTSRIYKITGGWAASSVLWSNQPPVDTATVIGTNSQNLDPKCPSSQPGWVSYGGTALTSLVQGWASATVPNYGVEYRSINEADNTIGKSYRSRQYQPGTLTTRPDGSTGQYGPFIVISYDAPAPTVTKSVVASTGTIGLGGAYSTGQVLTYSIAVKNNSPATESFTVDDPMAAGIDPELSSLRLDGNPCGTGVSCTLNQITGSPQDGMHVTGLSLTAGQTRTLSYVANVASPSVRICGPLVNTATATSGLGGSSAGTATVTTCGPGLGRESWWTFAGATSTGPQGDAAVNVANGNLVVRQLDSSQVPARGRLAYVLRRSYNSEDSAALSLPGGIGSGWVLNTGAIDGLAGVTPAGLVNGAPMSLLNPGPVTLIDRDGTRHTFRAKGSAGSSLSGVAVAVYNTTTHLFDAAGGVGPLAPRVVTTALDGTKFPTVCAETGFSAPPGVHLGLWRYVATTGAACSGMTDSNAMLLGYAAVRPDRLRTEYAWDGKLVSMRDAAGVELQYTYGAGLPPLPAAPTTTLPGIGSLSQVYEPTASCVSSVDSASNRQRVTPSTCRALTFAYGNDPNGATTCPVPSGANASVCVTDPAGRKTTYGLTGTAPAYLTTVANPDGTVLRYSYSGVAGAGACSPTAGQLCSASDPRGNTTSFSYSAAPGWASGGPAWVSQLTPRQDGNNPRTAYTFSYPSSTQTTTTRGTHVVDTSGIDSVGEVGETKQRDTSNNVYTDTVTSWDLTAGSCVDPQTAAPNPIDRNPCTVTRKQVGGAGAPDSVQHLRYNPDGMLLVDSRDLAGGPATTTSAYTMQYADGNGTRAAYADSLTGGGAVDHGTAARPAPATVLYTLDDRTAVLPPRGNAPGASVAAYRTSYVVDALSASQPNSAPSSVCSNGAATSNTGLVCEVDAPSPAGSGTAVTRYGYDTNGSRTTMTTPAVTAGASCPGGSSSYTYSYFGASASDLSGLTSSAGWLAGVTDPCGNFIANGYDRAGNVVRSWDRDATKAAGVALSSYPGTLAGPPSGAYTETLFNSTGESSAISNPWRYPVVHRDPLQAVAVVCNDADGNPLIRRAARALSSLSPGSCTTGTTTFDTVSTYAPDDQPLTVQTPAESSPTRYTYDGNGQQVAVTRPAGDVKVTVYDPAGRNVRSRWTRAAANDPTPNSPDGACTPGTLTNSTTDAPLISGRVLCESSTVYDGRNNVLSQYDAAGGRSDTTYDLLDRPVSHTVWRTATTQLTTRTSYDVDGHTTDACNAQDISEGRASSTAACSSNAYYATHVAFNPAGLPTTSTRYRVPSGTADGAGSPVTLTTTARYDVDGNPVSITDPNGHTGVQSRTYDVLDRIATSTAQRDSTHSNTTSYRYSPSGDTLSVTGPAPAGSTRITAYSYDSDHRVLDTVQGASSTDATQAGPASSDGGSNIRTRSFYDADGNPIATLTPNAFLSSTTSPDTRYLTRSNVDPDGRAVATFTPRTGVTVTDPLSGTPGVDCNTTLAAQPTSITAPGQVAPPTFSGTNVCVSKVSYDPNSRVSTITPAATSTAATTITYTDDDLRATVVSPNPTGTGTATTTFQYDGAGRTTLVKQPLQAITVTHHNLDGTEKDTWAPTHGGVVTTTSYNASGMPTDVTDPLGHISHTEYNSDATIALTSDSTWQLPSAGRDITRYGYDQNGNTVSVTSPSASALDTTNPAGAPTVNTYTYDNLLASTETPTSIALGLLTGYRRSDFVYDEASRRSSTHTYEETVNGSTITATPGRDAGTQTLSYYPDDRTAAQNGRTLLGSPPSITTTYDPAGQPTSINDTTSTPASTLSMTYYLDGLTRTVDDGTSSSAGHTTTYAYNGQAQVTARRDSPDNGAATTTDATYTYNSAGLPVGATEPALSPNAQSWTYDSDGRVTSIILPTSTGQSTIVRAYNTDNTLASQITSGPNGTDAQYTYTYDNLQRVTTQAASGPSATGGGSADTSTYGYTYDDAGRITTFHTGANPAVTATYDHDNNRLSYGTSTATYRPDNSLLTSNNLPVVLTPFGGVADDGCTTNSYDGFDRLTTTTPDGTLACPVSTGTSTYTYDGRDRQRTKAYSAPHGRTGASSITSHYDGLNNTLTSDVSPGLPDLTYQLGPDGTSNGVSDGTSSGTDYLLQDGNGHTTTLLDPTGALTCTARFDPWNNPLGSQSTSLCSSGSTLNETWTGDSHRDAATGNYQLGSRTYNPASASFNTPDTYRTGNPAANPGTGTDPLVANTYTYVNGDPVNGSDPTGHMTDQKSYAANHYDTAVDDCNAACQIAIHFYVKRDEADAKRAYDLAHEPWYKRAGGKLLHIAEAALPVVAGLVAGIACAAATAPLSAGASLIACATLAGAISGAVEAAQNCGGVGCAVTDVAVGAAIGAVTGGVLQGAGALATTIVSKIPEGISAGVGKLAGRLSGAVGKVLSRNGDSAAEVIPAGDAAVIGRSKAMFDSPELGVLRSAHGNGVGAEVNIGGSVIRYEPSYSGSGMTMFGDDGFILGRHAFSSQEELAKTLLHENYRLGYSQVPGIGANGDPVAKETGNAFDFAEMYFGHLLGGG